MKRKAQASPASTASEGLQRLAYRAAGHLLMDYLLRRGTASKYLPMDRSLMLPERKSITVNGAGTHWDELTSDIGSWMTVPQVLLAGYVAERIKFCKGDITLEAGSPPADKARHVLAAYHGYYGKQGELSTGDPRVEASLAGMHAYAAKFVQRHWAAVESVADALIRRRTLDCRGADELVRRGLLRGSLWGRVRLGLEGLGRRLQRRRA